jgi:pimeloyl-ACP methyl ester carboxylesterase
MLTGRIRVDEGRVHCPVFVAVGCEDRATPPKLARQIAAKYEAEYRQYDGQCHFLTSSKDVLRDVGNWVTAKVRE